MDVGHRFRESEEYELLQPYADRNGLVAGYRIEGVLSRDPWRHTIYEASTFDRPRVALKVLPLPAGTSRRDTRRFQHRVRARASIEHPNLLSIFDWGRLDDHYYIAMALCQAPTLADLLNAGPLKANGCLRLLGQLADALETAHERGVIHRDLAPENVLVAPRAGGHVLLGDFGVGNPDWGGGLLDLAELTHYVSPEKVRDEPLTVASNVYSLACILVECLSGSPPYTSELPGMVAYAHAAEPPPLLSERRAELPVTIDELVATAMAKDPDERLDSPRRLVAAAAASLGAESLAPQPVPGALHEREADDSSSANAASANGARPPQVAETLEPSTRRSGLRGPLLRSRLSAVRLPLRRRAAAPTGARPPVGAAGPSRNVLALALAVVLAGSGAPAFILGRSADDGSQTSRGTVDSARLRVVRERTAALRSTGVALKRLENRRANARRGLATARTTRAQAAEALRLVSAYGVAARAVPIGSRETRRAASLLDEAGQAYARLAAAARRSDRRGYSIAVRAVRRTEDDLQQAITRLNKARD